MERSGEGQGALRQPTYARTYYSWAKFYDLIFDLPFRAGRAAVARAVVNANANAQVLVAGVGTGLELELLPKSASITGIDLAAPMLAIARERVRRAKLYNVGSLRLMDAGALAYETASFDITLAPYLLSVTPTPELVLDEMLRVTRPGGELIILNHFSSEEGLRARLEAALGGAASWLGWRPDFAYAVVGDWLERQSGAVLVEKCSVAPFKLFTLLRIRKEADASA